MAQYPSAGVARGKFSKLQNRNRNRTSETEDSVFGVLFLRWVLISSLGFIGLISISIFDFLVFRLGFPFQFRKKFLYIGGGCLLGRQPIPPDPGGIGRGCKWTSFWWGHNPWLDQSIPVAEFKSVLQEVTVQLLTCTLYNQSKLHLEPCLGKCDSYGPVSYWILLLYFCGHPLGCSSGVNNQLNTWLILPVVICLSQRLSHACFRLSSS